MLAGLVPEDQRQDRMPGTERCSRNDNHGPQPNTSHPHFRDARERG